MLSAARCGQRQRRRAASSSTTARATARPPRARREDWTAATAGAVALGGAAAEGTELEGRCGRQRRGARRRHLPAPDSLGQRQDLGIRRQLQLLLPDLVDDVGVAERPWRITRLGERTHEPLRRTRVGGVDRGEPPPPEHRPAAVVACARGSRGGLEHAAVAGRNLLPLLLGPPGERGHTRQVEVAQERSGVDPRRLLERARDPCGLERVEIHLDQLGIEPQVAGAEDGLLGAQVLAQGVERLAEAAASALLLHFAPEQSGQAVAVHPAIPGTRQDGQNREPPRLLCVSTDRARAVEHGQAAKGLDALHDQLRV